MIKLSRVSVLIISGLSIVAALVGFYFTAGVYYRAWTGGFAAAIERIDAPYFYHALFIMSGICILCFGIMLICGIALLRGRFRWINLLIGVFIFEIIYSVTVLLWDVPGLAMSKSAAFGANGGLMAQWLILFPLWAPPILLWAKSRLEQSQTVV